MEAPFQEETRAGKQRKGGHATKTGWQNTVLVSFPPLKGTFKSNIMGKKGKRKAQGVPQSQTAALPRPQEEEETDKSKQA